MYWTGAHTKHRNMYHIVWISKYRRKVLRKNIAIRIEFLLKQCANFNRWQIHELNVNPDHVHMLVQLRPNVSVSKAVQLFKGGSSRVMRLEFPELEEFLWGDSLWADGFFSESIGKVDWNVIRGYIRNQ